MMKNILLALHVLAFGSMPLLAQPIITQQSTNQVVPIGSSASVGITAIGENLSYQWFKDGVRQISQTNSAINVASFRFTNGGSYSVVVSNANGLAISLPALLCVANAPLKAWGNNWYGQLGNGTTIDSAVPVNVATNLVVSAAGYSHSLFVKADGTLWAMGDNYLGELGIGTNIYSPIPVNVASNVVAAAAGDQFSLFVKTDGTLWAMGKNTSGQLGNGIYNNTNLPVFVASNVVAVAAGSSHALFVKADGKLWAMGGNVLGELGNGTNVDAYAPVNVASNVVAVAAGFNHSLFLTSDGTLWGMGANGSGQLGIGTTSVTNLPVIVTSNVLAVAAGVGQSMFLRTDGTMWIMGVFGPDTNYVTVDPPACVASNVVAVTAGRDICLYVMSDGTLWNLGNLGTNSPVQILGMTVASLGKNSVGEHSLAVAASLPPVLTTGNAVWTNGGQQLTIQLSGTPNYPYILQTTINLTPPVNWQSILTNPADGNGNWSFTVTNLPAPAGYYRAVAQ